MTNTSEQPGAIASRLTPAQQAVMMAFEGAAGWSIAPRVDADRRRGVHVHLLARHHGLFERAPANGKSLRRYRLTPLGEAVRAALLIEATGAQ